MLLRMLLFAWIAAALIAGFLWAPLVPVLGDTTRVFYFHFPAALLTCVAFGWSMLHSVLYLARRDLGHDAQAAWAAELGLLFCVVATLSGSLWAKAMAFGAHVQSSRFVEPQVGARALPAPSRTAVLGRNRRKDPAYR